ncbi:unnamed protein product [Didymodactylos carnosus]|uniref:Calcineurin-like phosphoesterase domain-containing protein n=1 Tax=Didymodactylos carnosus TaxID=1234261 RepID=A0A8S2J7T2_9BILA|nr:unnamed protein product [Didymodactylos carnosus]CAF3795489.1 unnamed protein product [Didymodactylos carnosus]
MFSPSTYKFCGWCNTPEPDDHPHAVLQHLSNIPPDEFNNKNKQISVLSSNIDPVIKGTGTEQEPFVVYKHKTNVITTTTNDHLRRLRFVCMSDTHNQIHRLTIPNGDVLLHCGDACKFYTAKRDLPRFNRFIGTLPHKYKIFISGNHETCIDEKHSEQTQQILSNLIYLQDSSTNIEGIQIYGSPWRPARGCCFCAEAFGYDHKNIQQDIWSHIPDGIDILITHVPPYSIRDYSPHSIQRVGCPGLLDEIVTRVKPRVSLFGHMHSQYGASLYRTMDNQNLIQFLKEKRQNHQSLLPSSLSDNKSNQNIHETLFLNVAVKDDNILNAPIVFDYYY